LIAAYGSAFNKLMCANALFSHVIRAHHMLQVSVPAQALDTRVEEAVTSLMRWWCAATRRGSATYLHLSIPGWPDFGWLWSTA